jgi:hypothetical protein
LEDEMDWLTRLSGSQAPNATAMAAVGLLALVAFVMRQRAVGVGFTLMLLAFGSTVGVKNASYSAIVSGLHHENNVAAYHDFARVLLFVALAQLGLAGIVGLISVGAPRLRWLGTFVVLTFAFAATSMLGWRSVYLHQDVNRPVHYVLAAPWASWVLLVGLAVAAIGAIVSLLRRPKPRPQH